MSTATTKSEEEGVIGYWLVTPTGDRLEVNAKLYRALYRALVGFREENGQVIIHVKNGGIAAVEVHTTIR